MLNSIESIVDLHSDKGNIEDAYVEIHFDDKILKLNTFTLKFTAINAEREDTKRWNNKLSSEIKKDFKLAKEIKEFRILFEALEKMKIKKGYIEKTERPDFLLKIDDKKIGIEITKIYSGNDWVPEKLYEDIKMYNMDNKDALGYIEYKKYNNKIVTYSMKENLVIKPLNKKEDIAELKVKTKNKIFEKVRKMFDEYSSYDKNIVLVNIVSPQYFESIDNIQKFNEELQFFITHLEANLADKEYEILMKLDKNWIKFDLGKRTCDIL